MDIAWRYGGGRPHGFSGLWYRLWRVVYAASGTCLLSPLNFDSALILLRRQFARRGQQKALVLVFVFVLVLVLGSHNVDVGDGDDDGGNEMRRLAKGRARVHVWYKVAAAIV